jgi:hypothetical protein
MKSRCEDFVRIVRVGCHPTSSTLLSSRDLSDTALEKAKGTSPSELSAEGTKALGGGAIGLALDKIGLKRSTLSKAYDTNSMPLPRPEPQRRSLRQRGP